MAGAARAPIAGKPEIRGARMVTPSPLADIPFCLVADLDEVPERLPEGVTDVALLGTMIPAVALAA